MCVHGNGPSLTIKGLRKYKLSKENPTPSKYVLVVKNMPVLELYSIVFAFSHFSLVQRNPAYG